MGKLKAHVVKAADHPEFGRWVGIDNRYYLVAFIPKTIHPVEISVEGTKDQTHLSLVETTQCRPRRSGARVRIVRRPQGIWRAQKI